MQIAKRFSTGTALVWFTLIFTAFIALFPMYWLFANAFTPITSVPPLTPILIPAFQLDNFQRLLVNNKFYST